MSHAMATPDVPFSNKSRSFTNLGSANNQEHQPHTNPGLATLGGAGPWRSVGMGGNGSLGSSGNQNTNDLGRSRDAAQSASSAEITGKTGSGSLVESSVSDDDYSYKTAWGARRSITSGRSFSQAQSSNAAQHKSMGSSGLSHTVSGASQVGMPFAGRPPVINLNSNSPAQPRPSFGSSFSSALSDRSAEQPPFNVYTKFDRPADPSYRKPDSAIGSWAELGSTPSPSDERRPQFPSQLSRTSSLPVSRDGSLPPSRQSDETPMFSLPDYSRPAQQLTPASSRAPSISSRNSAYTYSTGNVDQLSAQMGQLNPGGHSSMSAAPYKQKPNGNGFNKPPTTAGVRMPAFGRPAFRMNGNGFERTDDIEEIDRSDGLQLGPDDYVTSHQTSSIGGYPGSASGDRFSHAAASFEFRPGQSFNPTRVPSRSYELTSGSRSPVDWSGYSNGSTAVSRRSPGIAEQQPFIDPRLQQMMAAQLRNPYASAMFNPYALPHALQLNAAPPFTDLFAFGLHGLDPQVAQDAVLGNVQSALMYEFKSNTKTKRYELRDIYDHIAEFSGDQHGSRFIQTKLETANSDEKERVFREIEPNAIPLMTDVFGNYVIQKFFEHGDQTHKKILANKMRGQVLNLSMQMYGCRVVQKALDHVLVDQQASLLRELEGHVLRCVKDQNGNHVIQKAIERCPPTTIEFIIAAFHTQVPQLSIHPYGCRVIQRCLEKDDLPNKGMIMAELMDGVQSMISDQFGNYVVQRIVTHDTGDAKPRVLGIVGRGLECYSKHKFASNVVEKCLEQADDAWRREVVYSLVQQNNQRRVEGEGVLVGLIKDNFGNYVIQKLLDTLHRDDYYFFVDVLQTAMVQAKRTGCGKQVLSIDKKMHRFPSFRSGGVVPGAAVGPPYGAQQPYQMPLPTPPFASNFPSAATTPPPLTADTQSLQSSGLPSINGDTVGGAAATVSGKDHNDPSHDYGIMPV